MGWTLHQFSHSALMHLAAGRTCIARQRAEPALAAAATSSGTCTPSSQDDIGTLAQSDEPCISGLAGGRLLTTGVR
jgi:hypothetical protein